MPEDYFEDGPQSEKPMPQENQEPDGSDKSDQPTFLINAEVCPDMKPGDMMELRIVAVHDGEYEVAYQEKSDQENSEPEMPEEAPTSDADSMMD